MRTQVLCALGGLCAAMPGGSAAAGEPAVPTYLFAMTLHDGDRLVATPRVAANAGQSARIEIGAVGGSRYSLRIVATPHGATTVSVVSSVDITDAGGAHRGAQPSLVVGLGKASAFAFGAESPTQKPFRVDFTVEQVDAPALGASDPPPAIARAVGISPICRQSGTVLAEGAASPAVRPLGKMPPARHLRAVLRTVDGCEKPVVISAEVGSPATPEAVQH